MMRKRRLLNNVRHGLAVTKIIVGLDVLALFPAYMVPSGVTQLLRVAIIVAQQFTIVMAVGVVLVLAPYNETQALVTKDA